MMIKQLSLFVENRPGALSAVCQVLKNNRINIRTLSLADTQQFGILRLLVKEYEKAKEALGDLARSEEDIMSYICYPDQTMKFLADRKAKEENICKYSIVEA